VEGATQRSALHNEAGQSGDAYYQYASQPFLWFQARYLEEAAQRRALHNQLVDLKGAIRVFCRVRPLLARERAAKLEAATSCNLLNNTITVTGIRYAAAGA